jgi:spore coat protein U-like protein
MRAKLIGSSAVALLGLGATAYAATSVTSTFNVKMTIVSQCLAATTSNLNFPNTGVLSAAVPASTTLQVQCTNSTPYNIGLNQGANGSSVTTRQMKGSTAGALISYALYSDAAHTANWGNTIGTDTVAATGNGAAQSYTVYGQVPAQTTPAPDSYSDTITVTVTY